MKYTKTKGQSRFTEYCHFSTRILLLAFAFVSLGLGILGIFIPGLPTTVFILMSSWAAAKCSPKLSSKLLSHPITGPILVNWHNGGYVSRKSKIVAGTSMLICAGIIWLFNVNYWIAAMSSICMLSVFIWLWLRPEPANK
ncbi:YbaN family protein [Catenovulum sp. 2E275]|uniref:YbaN family protein n=1 Tax=Catenovulum sp. 2E275 TaxID=2980497 RepID=UPI0021D294A6|nr:YbaN family protein [Catenovulum sp. 2E275]MCU4677496.1 YbaN family protein [Catenovulum sp. 2E275]